MENGNGRREDRLDDALEDSFPASDPVSMTQPGERAGAPKQHAQTAAQSVKDTARAVGDTAQTLKNRVADKMEGINPDLLWLGGAFLLGAVFAIGAFSAPKALPRRNLGDRLLDRGGRLQRRLSARASDFASDYELKRKLSELIDRLQ